MSMEQPFNRDAGLSDQQAADLEARLESQGIRLLPFPFRHILAIVSDCDCSYPRNTWHALSTLCYDLNLDFGDSILPIDAGINMANSLFSPCFGHGNHLARSSRELTQLAELGLIDHIHGLWNPPPNGIMIPKSLIEWKSECAGRVVALKRANKKIGRIIKKEVSRRFVRDYRAAFLDLDGYSDIPPELTFISASGWRRKLDFGGIEDLSNGRKRYKYHLPLSSGNLIPRKRIVNKVSIDVESREARDAIEHLCLLAFDGELEKQVLDHLGSTCRPVCRLFIDHNASGFLTDSSAKRHREQLASVLNILTPECVRPFWLDSSNDDVDVSLLPDDPNSPLYILDHFRKLGVRFINPSGSSGEPRTSLHPLQVTSPTIARDGKPITVVRRVLPVQDEEFIDLSLGKFVNKRSRITTFASRLMTVLNATQNDVPQAIPFYTHIGADQRWEHKERQFDSPAIQGLQDRVFNFSGKVKTKNRICVMRASCFYQYLYMMTQIADHVDRVGPNEINIKSWSDPHTGNRVPENIAELYGLTVTVDRAEKAKVTLDSSPLSDVLRIGEHIGEKEELVTVLSGGIRQRVELAAQSTNEVVSAPNILGAIQYIGIEGVNLHEKWHRRLRWGVRIASRSGFSLFIGTRSMYRKIPSCSGYIFLKALPEEANNISWFSLALATWKCPKNESQLCFSDEVDISVWSPASVAAPVGVVLMKPSNDDERMINTEHFRMFHAWRKHVKRTNATLKRTSQLRPGV